MNPVQYNIDTIKRLCRQHKVKKLFVFGSVLSGSFNGESDIDFIVDFNAMDVNIYADNYFDLKFSLEDLLLRPVDMVEEKTIGNPYFKKAVDQQKQLIYEA